MASPKLISKHDQSWLARGSSTDPRLIHSGPDDKILLYPSDQGYRQEIIVSDALSIVIIDYALQQDFWVEDRGEGDWFKFEFPLAGQNTKYSGWHSRIGGKASGSIQRQGRAFELEILLKRPLLEEYYLAVMDRLPEQVLPIAREVLDYFYTGTRHKISGLTVGELSSKLLTRPPEKYPESLLEQPLPEDIFCETAALYRYRFQWRTPAMDKEIAYILNCPYKGSTRRRYLKRRALKLISIYLEEMCRAPLPQVELDSIYGAAAILRQQMINPPVVEQLARQVYTNRLKLYQGFRTIYGTTPLGYLRRHRMDKAQFLLITTELSVTQVAAAVGYRSRNRFATAFRQCTGLNPKTLQLNEQRNAS
ncbi:MAG: helix-turn-helix transcriptional regulator [Cyanobacteria bacterium P01_F01_bin.153]